MELSIRAAILFKVPNQEETSVSDCLNKLEELRQVAVGLPFEAVSNIVHLKGLECALPFANKKYHHSLSNSMLQFEFPDALIELPPQETVFFTAYPGKGCEPATFGLSRYPDRLEVEKYFIKSQYPGAWLWQFDCTTQYASNVSTEHFVKCHKAVCALLREAISLGIDVNASDDSEFWDNGDEAHLIQEMTQRNKAAAIVTRTLADVFGPDNIQHPIQDNIAYITANANR